MASGFIILPDGRCLAARHAVHDALIRSVAAAVAPDEPLRRWLHQQVQFEGEACLGHGFVRRDGESVQRCIDLRGLTEHCRVVFVSAARRCGPIAGVRAPLADVVVALERLRAMLDAVDRNEPPLSLSDWLEVAPPCEGRVGPGWEDPA